MVSRRTILASGLALGAGLLLPAAQALPAALPSRDRRSDARAAETRTDLLILGAGPFGLSLAAQAQAAGIDHTVVGVPMGFWKTSMPQGMYLRSGCDWSLDPLGVHTIAAYLGKLAKTCGDVQPLSRDFYLDYAEWFRREKGIQPREVSVTAIDNDGRELVALTTGGARIRARHAVLAIGFGNFANVPGELAAMLPKEHSAHTSELVDFSSLGGRRVLIVGGRQSAFEWAALIREAGAAAVDLAYRHDTPSFATSDWRWVDAIVDRLADDPGWYRRLSPDGKRAVDRRFWSEGRLKLEPWLAPRIDHPNVTLHPRTRLTGADSRASGIDVALDDGEVLTVDQVVLATGYKVDMARVPFLASGLGPRLQVLDGFPVLDDHFETSIPGLYVTSLAATRDFGSFLAFTVSVRAQAKVISRAIAAPTRARAARLAGKPRRRRIG